MTTPPSDGAHAPAPWQPLDATQRRVLGVLIEKAKTTPAAYPLTVNAIVIGSNQKNNRDPLTALDDIDVERALDGLARLKVVSEIDWMGRVPKYKHHAYEWLGVNKVEIAVMTELLLRGAQALGELRGRAARMEPIADLAVLKPVVDGLVARGLMVELTAPGRGQIVSHNLYLGPELTELRARFAGHVNRTDGFEPPDAAPVRAVPPVAAPAPAPDAVVAELARELVALREEVARLRDQVRALESRLEAAGG